MSSWMLYLTADKDQSPALMSSALADINQTSSANPKFAPALMAPMRPGKPRKKLQWQGTECTPT